MPSLLHLLTATLAFTTPLMAIRIPANQTYGVYTVTTDGAGNDIFTKISDVKSGPPVNPHTRRATTWPTRTNPVCADSRWLKQYDFYTGGAWQAFFDACWSVGNTKFKDGKAVYAYWGDAVAYMCSYQSNPCNVREWGDAVAWVQNSCGGRDGGWMQPGWLSIPAWKKVGFSPLR